MPFFTIKHPTEGVYKEKGSKFLAFAFPVASEEAVKAAVEEVRRAHPKARHHCFAYRLSVDGNRFRANDAGEPSGTAGRPILGQIDSKNLTQVLVVVVRYFGGTLLGVSGLINAYRSAAADALERAILIPYREKVNYRLDCDYAILNQLMDYVKNENIEITEEVFDDRAHLDISFEKDREAEVLERLGGFEGVFSKAL